jgi:hypothetical protein
MASMARNEALAKNCSLNKFMKDYMLDAALGCPPRQSRYHFTMKSFGRLVREERLSSIRLSLGILRHNLTLTRNADAGKGRFEDYFLCNNIEDEDLPWDIM